MIGFKGVIPKAALTNDAFQSITKKAEQFKRSGQLLLAFYQQIVKYQQMKYTTNTKTIQQFGNTQYQDSFNKNFITTFINIISQQKYLIEVLKSSSEQSQQFCNKLFGDLGIVVNRLYQYFQSYQEYQQITYQDSKKYFKIYKNMLNAIQLYKASLTDVNLIYNQDQKIKRYENCQVLYQSAYVEYRKVGQKCGELMKKKGNIRECYKTLLLQFQGVIKKIAQHCIGKAQRFLSSISEQTLKIQQKIRNFEKLSQNIKFQSVISDAFDQTKLQYFVQSSNIKIYENQLPIILLYHEFLKEQHLGLFNIQITNYLKLIQERLKTRKIENKKLLDVLGLYFKNLQKIQSPAIKEMLINFEKNRKKISQCYGNRLVTFFKAITSIFQIYVGVYQRLWKTISTILESMQNNINQDAKLQKFFSQEINTNIERFTVKKQLKKPQQYLNDSENKASDIQLIRKQIGQKAQFIKNLITGFQQKIDKNSKKLTNNYNKISSHLRQSSKQFYQFCNQYAQLYFGDKTFQTNLQKFYVDFESTRNKNKQAYNQFQINSILNDQTIIAFQGQFAKIQDFKKLKKPARDQDSVDDNKSQIQSSYNQQNSRNQSNLVKQESNRGTLTQVGKQFKNAEFLKTKIIFKQNQKLIKTYSCGLAEKIVLQGKIYITTQRICFYSNFNSQNLFFGRTFIQFPKTDIKKIQKRKVSILIDNSISFTTVNGQIFFTSFFSRDEAYDLICKTYNFNIDNDVYEYDQQNQAEELPQFLLDFEQNDDIKINQIDQRKQKIQKQLVNYPFSEAASVQIVQQGLNALKIFKIFYQDFQIIFNNKKYESYLKYIKSSIGHKDLQIQEWSPSLTTILNKSNIKQNSPFNCKRKLKMTIPVANTGVPFMPKTAKSEQTQTLYIFSKHKFILQSTVQTSGIPYADNFKVQLRTTVISNEDGKCKVTIQYFVNFVKNSMMKNVIQSKSKEETTGASKIWVDQIKNYFQILHQKSKKKNENLPKKSVEQISNQLQNANSQLQNLKEENKNLKSELQQTKKNQKLWKNLLISSLVLNVLIILIYIF